MLILSRRPGDAILIEGGIRVIVLACDKRGVRIGIEAPTSVSILREEIVEQITSQNQGALATPAAKEWLAAKTAPKPDEPTPNGEAAAD